MKIVEVDGGVRYIDPRHKVLWHMHHLAQIRATGKTSAPVNVEIDLSNRCSLGCEWCHFAYTHTRGPLAGTVEKPRHYINGGDLMPLATAKRILWELAHEGVQSVTWTGGGEPTLHPDFDEIIGYAADQGLQQGLYTHGGHISIERAAILKELCTWVYVSLDECDAEEYRKHKGADRFKQATDGVRRLANAYGRATVGVGFLIHPGNYTRLHEMAGLARELGADYCQLRPTIQYRQGAPDEVDEDTAWMADALPRLHEFAGDSFVSVDLARFEEYMHWQGHGYERCNWSALQTVITPNGKVWRCVNKRERSDALLGDLEEESFGQIWERAGGTCAVDGECRVMCRGHVANITLDEVLTRPAHAAFI